MSRRPFSEALVKSTAISSDEEPFNAGFGGNLMIGGDKLFTAISFLRSFPQNTAGLSCMPLPGMAGMPLKMSKGTLDLERGIQCGTVIWNVSSVEPKI